MDIDTRQICKICGKEAEVMVHQSCIDRLNQTKRFFEEFSAALNEIHSLAHRNLKNPNITKSERDFKNEVIRIITKVMK